MAPLAQPRTTRAADGLLAEQRRFGRSDAPETPADYLGAIDQIIDAVLDRAGGVRENYARGDRS